VKLVVGLGNPGIEYQFTPHNMGFLAIDRIAERSKTVVANRRSKALTGKVKIGSEEVLLAKPETFMNLSGVSVRELLDSLGLDAMKDMVVVYDELDLPFGQLRIRERGSAAGHNGMRSIIGTVGTQEFMRVRLGVNPGHPIKEGAKYLLSPMKKRDLEVADEMLEKAADAVETIFTKGIAAAMNVYNRKPETGEPEAE
jgi:PTH1 family peptidyl-tRNA hydrolase